jgi:hypothetical protein
MNDKLFDALEVCLQEIENGAALENVLARFPDLARELRPILKASIQARSLAAGSPSPEAVRRGRAKLLQRASEMKEAKAAPRRRVIPIFQRLALSLGMAATFLLSGTGLVGASATALPGENLYPVKRTWEDLQLLFILDQDTRDAVKSQFEVERLHEVNELLAEGRHEVIQFAGVFMQINGTNYISGVTIVIPSNLQFPENGAAVIVTGRTNAQGFVELESIEVLPDGVFVPVGKPVEVETESESESNSNSDSFSNTNSNPDTNSNEASDSDSLNINGSSSASGSGSGGNSNDATPGKEPSHREDFEVEGVVQSLSETSLVINGKTVYLDQTIIEGSLQNGVKVEIKGYYAEDGRFIVTELKVKRSGSGDNNENSNSGSSDDNSGSSNDGGSNDGGSNDGDSNDGDSNDNDGGDSGSNDNDGGHSNDNNG